MRKKVRVVTTKTKNETGFYSLTGIKITTPEGDKLHTEPNKFVHFTSDEEIKSGDIFMYKEGFLDGTVKTQEDYDNSNWVIKTCGDNETAYTTRAQTGRNSSNGLLGCVKIVATSDSKLEVIEEKAGDDVWVRALPKIPYSFKESYAKNPVEYVELEYKCAQCYSEDVDDCWSARECSDGKHDMLKLTSNNEVIVHFIDNVITIAESVYRNIYKGCDINTDISGVLGSYISFWEQMNKSTVNLIEEKMYSKEDMLKAYNEGELAGAYIRLGKPPLKSKLEWIKENLT